MDAAMTKKIPIIGSCAWWVSGMTIARHIVVRFVWCVCLDDVATQVAKSESSQTSNIMSERRAFGGCLGTRRRRRTWHAAKSLGEPRAGFDPRMSEWGNPSARRSCTEYIGA